MTVKLVVDANRIFSALLKDGETRRALMTTSAMLHAPRFLRQEIERHKGEIIRRSRGDPDDVEALLAVLYRRISWVGDEALAEHMPRAEALLGGTDPKDVAYLACAFAVDAEAIWSHDLDFDIQTSVPRIPHPDASIP